MLMFLLLAALSVWAITSTVTALRTDGYRQVPTDPRRLP